MATISVKDSSGTPTNIEKPLAPGQAAMAASRPVVIASDQSALTITGTVAATQSGTWNVGTVTAVTAISNALPVGANVIGKVSIDQTTDGTTNLVAAKQSGTWNVGTVTTVTTVSAVTAISNALPAGEGHLGSIGGDGALLTVTPTLDTSAYASGDTFFDTMAVSGAFRVNQGRAILNSITVIDKDDQGFGFDLVFFDATCTFGTINVAPSIADADAANALGVVSIPASSFIDLGGNRVASVSGVGLTLKAASASTTLYMAAIIRGAGTYTASGTIIKLGLLWD